METPSTIESIHYPTSTAYLEPAGQGRRLANLLIDSVGIMGAAISLGVICALLGFDSFLDSLDQPLMSQLVGIVLFFIYYLFFETVFGRTLGKLVTGTEVVMEDGSKPPFAVILKRTLWRCVPFNGFSFLGSAQGWHDTKSETIVVRVRRS